MSEGFNLGQILGKLGDPSECPVGEQVLEAKAVEVVRSKNGDPMLKVKAFIVGGPHAGRSVMDNITFIQDNPDALGFFYVKIAAWGAADQGLLDQCVGTLQPLADAMRGNRAKVILEPNTWNGKTRPQVKEYIGPAGQGNSAPATYKEPAQPEEVEF